MDRVNVLREKRAARKGGSFLFAGMAGRDGEPVPYEGVRNCGIVSKEFVGEAFRLPGRQCGSLRLCGSGEKGRETRPLRGCSILCRCIDRIRRGGVSPPVRGAYLADGTLPSGEGGDDTQGTGHALEARTAGRDGRPVPYEMFLSAYLADGTNRAAEVVTIRRVPGTHWKPALRAGTGNPSPTRSIGTMERIERRRW